MTNQIQGRKREGAVGELGNVARHERGLTNWRGGRGRSGLVSLETWHVQRGHTPWGGGEGGGGLGASGTWAAPKKDPPTGGEEEGGAGCGAWKSGTSQMRP